MNQLLQISLITGIIFTAQAVRSVSSQAEIVTQPVLTQNTVPEQDSQTEVFTFNFNNTYDYNACLDVILLAYEGRKAELENVFKNDCATNVLNTFGSDLSKDIALRLVDSANYYATEELENPLYPTLGVRRRIAINLGYVYEADRNNPDILKYINPES